MAPPTRCLKAEPLWSGAAALATVSALHGVPLEASEASRVSYVAGETSNQEGNVLVMARALGYEAVAMEGEYENLPEVTLPMLVALREKEADRYAVLFAVEDAQVTVGDPSTGEVSVWPRDRFAQLWTGSVVQLTPVDAERQALATSLAELRDRLRQFLLAIGWAPPYARRIALLVAWVPLVALAAVASNAPHSNALGAACAWLVAAGCAVSLWSWLASDSCAACSQARRLGGGLPIPQAGAVLYAGLLASAFFPVPPVVIGTAIGAALGAHAALLAELAKARVSCWACVLAGALATGAAGVAVASGAPVVALAVAAVAAGLGGAALLPRARAREEKIWRVTAEALAERIVLEPRPAGVRLVALTRKGCPSCAFFHAAVKPALLATFGESLHIDERDLGDARTSAPVLVLLGGRRTLFIGLPPEDACQRLIATVGQAVEAGAESSEPMIVLEG